MYAKQKRALLLLGAAVAVLVIVLLAVRGVSRHKAAQSAADASSSAGAFTEAGVKFSSLSYNNGTATLSFAKNDDGRWYWVDDPDFPLEESYLTKLTNTLTGLRPQQTITDGDPLEDYGLDAPAITLSAKTAAGDTLTFALGNRVAGDSGSYYLLMNGDKTTVYVVDPSLHTQLSAGIYSMMALPELPVLRESQIASITVAGKQQTLLTSTVVKSDEKADSSAGNADTVSWRSDGGNVTDNPDAQKLISAVSALSLSACQDYKPTAKAASLCGFDAPRAVLSVAYTDDEGQDGTLELSVGGNTPDGQSCYVRLKDDSTIYSMPAESLSAILSAADSGLSA
ncbi:MAG: DUF4340 domain-containing protein [Oscillibacter sp.]|jgi:hypothetical protein|nr:DUF4340 domain-containing protein [Oscillibacter sp.]